MGSMLLWADHEGYHHGWLHCEDVDDGKEGGVRVGEEVVALGAPLV